MKKLLLLVISLSLAGCAATQNKPMDASTMAALKGKSLILVKRESPSFIAMTSGKGMFAVVGVGAAAAAGNELVRENKIVDPAMTIATSLGQTLNTRYGLRVAGKTSAVADSDDLNKIVELAGNSDYALDVVSTGWMYIYDGFKFSDYFVRYTAKLRLIDVRTSTVVSSGVCAYDPKNAGKPAVTHEKLLQNNAAYIKQELSDATKFCTAQLINGLS